MKLLNGLNRLAPPVTTPTAAPVAGSNNAPEITVAKDEITDEALLEAIVGTGTSGCGGGDTRGPASPASIGRRHFHKHA